MKLKKETCFLYCKDVTTDCMKKPRVMKHDENCTSFVAFLVVHKVEEEEKSRGALLLNFGWSLFEGALTRGITVNKIFTNSC